MRTRLQRLRRLAGRLWHCRRGAAAVEFGLAAPLFIVLSVGTLEFGYYLHQADTLEKSLRAGAMYAARTGVSDALSGYSSSTKTKIENMVKTGDTAGSGNLLLAGWNGCSNCLDISVINRTVTENSTDANVNVIKLKATVPYVPVVPGALGLVGFGNLRMQLSHEQAFIGS